MNTSKSLKEIFNDMERKIAVDLFRAYKDGADDTGAIEEALRVAAAAIVEAVEGIYGDSDGLREFAGLNLIKPVPEVPSKRKEQ